ncbi:MAG TPA: hypothetical protein VLB87_02760 [Pyrinomonadaceae bacterium]|nr:hypothetical protein [Pyrinomonadaceae bacterium]
MPPSYAVPAADANNNTKTFKWFLLNVGQVHILYFDGANSVDTPDVSQRILDNFRNQVSTHGKLVADLELNLSGHPGREFKVRNDGGTQIDRIYLAGNRVYIVSVFVLDSLSCKMGEAVKVLDTFEIIDAQ